MVQENRLGAQGVLGPLIHRVQRLTGISRVAAGDPTSVRAHVHVAQDPRKSGDAAEAAAVCPPDPICAEPREV
jgi:hypothetical protein